MPWIPVGLVVVGLGGVGSSLVAGILAARAHLVHPFGSLVEAGGAGRPAGSNLKPLRDQAPFAELGDLALGAFELRDGRVHVGDWVLMTGSPFIIDAGLLSR